ncbi:mucin-5AC-like [Ischnura elegans]|uniref:mucin-5AC-like n=1 Tax=Ischnura elegans TaxID=197161 RepID=UPI001ED890F8|nr:mucin-5AC-like [Ischnura elegans]
MERGFLLLLGSIVALAIAASASAQLDPEYQGGEEQQLQQQGLSQEGLQYLPGENGRRRNGRRKNSARRPGSRNRGPAPGSFPGDGQFSSPGTEQHQHLPPALPEQFAGALDGESGAAPGEPGIDYPIYSHIPVTSFSCEGKIAGYYADPETQCQIFHVCTPGGATSNSFICPNGTLFNPAVRTCDWWPAVDCGASTESLRLNFVEKRAKDKSQATQSLLGGPGTRIKPQRTHNRQHNQGFQQKFTNEVLSQDTNQETGRQSFKSHQPEQIPQSNVGSIPVQQPQTAGNDKYAITYENRQDQNTVAHGGRNPAVRRRPPGSKRFPNQSLKRNQYLRTTTPSAFTAGSPTVGEIYNPQVTTQRTTASGNFNLPQRSHTVTRFDITSETLDFPSFRHTPSTTTYRTPTVQSTYEPVFSTTKGTTRNRISRPKPQRLPSTVQVTQPSYDGTVANVETSTITRARKPTRIVTQAPSVDRSPIAVQPINVRFRQPPSLRVPSTTNEPIQISLSSPHPTAEVPYSVVVTTPSAEHFSVTPVTSEQPLENSIFQNSPTFATFVENPSPVRPIVVASPQPAVAPQKKLFPSGFMAPQPVLESFEPLTAGDDVPSQSNSAGNIDTSELETRGGFTPSSGASFAQSFAGSTADQGTSPAGGVSIAQSFAQSGAFSGDLKFSDRDDFPFFAGQAGGDSPNVLGFEEPQSSEKEAPNLSSENTNFGPFTSSFAQSFASADSFASGDGFQQSVPVSSTTPTSPPPKATTFRPLNIVTVKASPKPTTTTIKPVYTPTVPQTTARPTTHPPKKFATTTTTTTRPSTSVTAPTTTTVRTPPTPRPISSTTASFQTTTTKKPKGFYITLAPPSRPSTVQQSLDKDKAPKDNSISYPSSTYYPTPTQSPPTPQFSPSLFYPPTRSSHINVVPNSYFRASTRTQYSPGSLVGASPVITSSGTVSGSDATVNIVDTPIKSTSFEIKTVQDGQNGSGFTLSPPSTYAYQSQASFDYQPDQSNQRNETGKSTTTSEQTYQGATEPPFVIQKSVELFASHEVAYHPSVFSQTSYSLSSLQGDYNTGRADQIDFQPPPYIEPSPNARGFGNWNLNDADEKRISENS